jgi:hypothetical protein
MLCKTCGTTDPSNFYPTQKTKYCRPCHREKYFNPGRARLLASKLERKCCTDCGLPVTPDNSAVFDYDHLRDKKYHVALMTTQRDELFFQEIAKCELACANCHRMRTVNRRREKQSSTAVQT